MRIVSLVPSLTETLVHYGLLSSLVGRTSYCEEPRGRIEGVEAVGGTKNPDLGRIVELAPDLVIVNREENRAEDAEALARAGLRLHVTHPRSVAEAADMLEALGMAVERPDEGRVLAAACRRALAGLAVRRAEAGQAEGSEHRGGLPRRLRVFCPIWRRPWMTFHEETYIGDVLRVSGFDNIFAGGGLDSSPTDFFEVSLAEVARRDPGAVLLPDEPFRFQPKHATELEQAGVCAPVAFIDGKIIAWYGPRIPGALIELAALARRLAGRGAGSRPTRRTGG